MNLSCHSPLNKLNRKVLLCVNLTLLNIVNKGLS